MAITDTREIRFEADIEAYLLENGGYTPGTQLGYDKYLALNVETLAAYLQETQPAQWRKHVRNYPDDPVKQLGKRVNQMIETYGLLHVLRNEVTDRGVRFKLVGFKPETTLNTEVIARYKANRMEVIRQFSYESERHYTIDMVLSINGIPVVALELKNQAKGQNMDHAKAQFMRRNHKEKCFQFNQRLLAYFAVDLNEA